MRAAVVNGSRERYSVRTAKTVGISLLILIRHPKLLGVKLLLGFGLLLGIIAYLSPAMGESTMMSALLYQLGMDDAGHTITRVLLLLPLFFLLIAISSYPITYILSSKSSSNSILV